MNPYGHERPSRCPCLGRRARGRGAQAARRVRRRSSCSASRIWPPGSSSPTAQTRGELEALTRDLPAPPLPAVVRPRRPPSTAPARRAALQRAHRRLQGSRARARRRGRDRRARLAACGYEIASRDERTIAFERDRRPLWTISGRRRCVPGRARRVAAPHPQPHRLRSRGCGRRVVGDGVRNGVAAPAARVRGAARVGSGDGGKRRSVRTCVRSGRSRYGRAPRTVGRCGSVGVWES